MVEYIIDNINIKTLGVYVSESLGVVDLPKPKTDTINQPNDSGKYLDLSLQRFEERNITLKCFLEATNYAQFVERVEDFSALISGGLKRLRIMVNSTPLIYDVYLSSGIQIKKKWREQGAMVGEFSVTLTEPEPKKAVYRLNGKILRMQITTPEAVTVAYGDGELKTELFGENIDLGHTFQGTDINYIAIHGNVEKMQILTTNAIKIW